MEFSEPYIITAFPRVYGFRILILATKEGREKQLRSVPDVLLHSSGRKKKSSAAMSTDRLNTEVLMLCTPYYT